MQNNGNLISQMTKIPAKLLLNRGFVESWEVEKASSFTGSNVRENGSR